MLDFYSTSGCGEFLLIEPNYYFLLFETEPLGGGAIAYKKEKSVIRKCNLKIIGCFDREKFDVIISISKRQFCFFYGGVLSDKR
ncbi:hypothetical protein [Phocaeicola sartorii]|uniref:hypothetical protein n=1 Tax=Phocaeicola sartorii TaxID=671267 RepID=UPI0010081309|nr:hypothetical protein [Phocaeicola sartorii]